jgi:DNA-3-methyladenine glycosylase II
METRTPDWWPDAVSFLQQDELLKNAVQKYGTHSISSRDNLFQTLIKSIVGQQISVAAADSIWKRLSEHIGEMTPENVLRRTQESIASCGVTRPKASYIYGLAEQASHLIEQPYDQMSDEEIKKHLISFRGIGPWTAEMMLMFHFLRPDVFSIGDIGLVRAVEKLVPEVSSKEEILAISERWKPYRTAASWYLWRTIDPEPVEY